VERRGYAIKLAYDGRAFHGWQRQSSSTPVLRTVQQTLDEGLRALDVDAPLVAAARTDAGVSARAQVVSLRLRRSLSPETLARLQALLPRAMRLLSWAEVDRSFHARASALAREYRYRLPALAAGLDLEAVQRFLAGLPGTKDRRSYVLRPRGPMVSTVLAAEVHARPSGAHVLRFVADRYGRRLVRNWVWAALCAARGEPCLSGTAERGWLGPTAPASGLLLWEVRYAFDPFSQKRS
jgi:tRNA pseudouridine38-40 synthase